MLKRTLARFDRLDGDNDGRVTEDEREAASAARRSQGGPGGGDGGGRGFGGGFGRADADADGVITRAEVEAQTRDRFARLDADKDGTVTPDEMQAAFAAFRERGQGGGDGN
jgi:Ca2+-binding EF-hand superfamily protein